MVAKKSPGANLENKKSLYVLIGFVFALSLVFITLEWSKANVVVYDNLFSATAVNDEDIILPNTVEPQTTPPPPPPPRITDIINVVDDQTVTVESITGTEDTGGPVSVPDVTVSTGDPIEETGNEIIMIPEHMPEFIGNVFEYLSKNVRYPQDAIDEGAQGRVTCEFVVNRDGSIVDVRVMNPIHPSLDKEAIRVIQSMPKWKPGKQNGKAVRVKFILPVNFKLM